ncbi:MAG: deoxyribodipyrimidine photo-lyase [Thermoanaerobaculia bacterium]|nr:deoxyribodipyrimidine photo-lyase [Thermoanaerobaculia bacterium]
MATATIHPDRIRPLNDRDPTSGRYVLYWMQQSQRAEHNDALEYAVRRANEAGLPLLVGFGLTADYPDANLRHYRFMLEGLEQTARALRRRGIAFVLREGDPADIALQLAGEAALVVCDRGYLRHQVRWRERVATEAEREVVQVEADAVVPVESASEKREYAARTLRPKIHRTLDEFLVELRTTALEQRLVDPPEGLELDSIDEILDRLPLDRSVDPVTEHFRGGTSRARARLRRFLDESLASYADGRSPPESDHVSRLSPYLHFGQISPVYVALRISEAETVAQENREAFLEQLIVRRELAINFVRYTPDYDSWESLPEWARETLEEHGDDERDHRYEPSELEDAATHDEYWNAAMAEMKLTGYTHNTMRMYWGKKILEWSKSPREAWELALELNNRYFLDGRDPSSWANVGWVFGLHDRPWPERPIFGKVRSMTASGLERKYDPGRYVERVERL